MCVKFVPAKTAKHARVIPGSQKVDLKYVEGVFVERSKRETWKRVVARRTDSNTVSRSHVQEKMK